MFAGAGEGKVSNQTLINGLKRLEVEGKIRRHVQSDRTVVYSLTSVLEELTKKTFDGSLETKIVAALSIYTSLYPFASATMSHSLSGGKYWIATTILVLWSLSFFVGGLGLWKLRRWSWYILMAASIGHIITTVILGGPIALLLFFSPQGSLWILLPLIIAAYLWYRRDILKTQSDITFTPSLRRRLAQIIAVAGLFTAVLDLLFFFFLFSPRNSYYLVAGLGTMTLNYSRRLAIGLLTLFLPASLGILLSLYAHNQKNHRIEVQLHSEDPSGVAYGRCISMMFRRSGA